MYHHTSNLRRIIFHLWDQVTVVKTYMYKGGSLSFYFISKFSQCITELNRDGDLIYEQKGKGISHATESYFYTMNWM